VEEHVHAPDAEHGVVEVEAVEGGLVEVLLQLRVAEELGVPLAEVLAGTSMDPSQFLAGSWPDVIALLETGEPIAIFARGFGPLLIAGRPITGAIVNSETFGNVTSGTTTARR